MKLKILTATTRADLEEEFNSFSESHKIVQVTPDSDDMIYILFVFYEENPVYKKEGDEFIDELTSLKKGDSVEEHLETNYQFFKDISNFIR